MKDRLPEFLQKAKHLEESKAKEDEREGNVVIRPQAVVFEREPIIEVYLQEIRKLQNEIKDLSEHVTKFGQQQKVLVSTMRRFSVLKKDSNITQEIKVQAEGIKKHLDTLLQEVQKTETERGPSSSVTRVLKIHHAVLFQSFQSVMIRYNEAIISKQANCKKFIVRQLEVAGKEVGEVELDNMMEQGRWDIFNENHLHEVKITKGKLNEIEQRHKELITLENQIKDLRDIFLQVFILVEEQGETLNNIERVVMNAEEYIQKTNEKIKLAVKYKKRNPCKKLFCCCCPGC
ncbi:syntaxin-19 isoform 1-T2 [Anomaloglossus baeobatrachus]|uniref:syntaxin-19 n=1 Tax=Anomaloglossus baeobatrachus TaxID=238106 RepID=UPI003F509683